jgi:hypothetical protein
MTPETPLPLNSEEHRELAEELRAATERLQPLCDLIVSVYGSESRAAASFRKALEALERLQAELAAQARYDSI